MRYQPLMLVICLLLIVGCADRPEEKPVQAEPQEAALPGIRVDGKKEKDTGIIGKYTQEVGEFDPTKKDQKISKSQVEYSNPITGPAEAYVPITEKIAKLNIEQAVRVFKALHDRYPKDHEEFMQKIIKENGIRLPKLPANRRYQYDVENHQLVVVILPDPKEKKE